MKKKKVFALAKQAKFEFDSNHNKFYASGFSNDLNQEILSFANLLIQECLCAIKEEANQFEIPAAGKFQSEIFSNAITTHFEIKSI